MKNSAYMLAIIGFTFVFAAVAVAGTIDIGPAQMEQGEFQVLQQMVAGNYQESSSDYGIQGAVSPPSELSLADVNVDTVRNAMGAVSDETGTTRDQPITSPPVDFGMGIISVTEFCSLNQLVTDNGIGTELASVCDR